jgi:hypothetical protein
MSTPMFEFDMIYVHRPDDPYYVTNWDRAVAVTVMAVSRKEAFTTLWAMLGDAPRHRYWTAQIRAARQVVAP